MIQREATELLIKYKNNFRSIAITGPRQSGKSTLVRAVFTDKPYVSLENTDLRAYAQNDTRGFLKQFAQGAVIDEAQKAPEIFNYLQQILDETNEDGLFILTGSNNFLLLKSITQSLAGRVGYMELLPLSYNEILRFNTETKNTNYLIWRGSYPELFDKNRENKFWYPAYLSTYVERDVRQIINIGDSLLFAKFLKLCAGRVGQQLVVAHLANDCGIDVETVNRWLGILKASYIIYLLPPHSEGFNKRLIKSPKLYFYDTGLASHLLGFQNENELWLSHFKGALFENYVINEFLKAKQNYMLGYTMYYWRDSNGVEIDLLLDFGTRKVPIEIKTAETFRKEQLNNLKRWNNYANQTGGYVIYDGEQKFELSENIVVQNWRTIPFDKL